MDINSDMALTRKAKESCMRFLGVSKYSFDYIWEGYQEDVFQPLDLIYVSAIDGNNLISQVYPDSQTMCNINAINKKYNLTGEDKISLEETLIDSMKINEKLDKLGINEVEDFLIKDAKFHRKR